MITIITPTYNRGHTLPILYESLVKQTSKNFEWLIVDDGSTDNTSDIVNGFISKSKIKIRYLKKYNGGKHTALNVGFNNALTEWILIVDSDDWLKHNSIEYLFKEASKLSKDYVSISFLRTYPDGKIIGDKFNESQSLENYLDRISQNIAGDKADLIRTDALNGFAFPEFKGENFLAESPMFLWLTKKGRTKFLNFDGYVCEYLAGGLTDNSIKNRYRCVNSTLYVYKNQYNQYNSLKLKFRAATNWWRFKNFRAISSDPVPIIYYPFGLILNIKDRIQKKTK